MERELVSEQIDSLRVEALEARRLAETLGDTQSIRDLESYAAQLEAEAERLCGTNRDGVHAVPPELPNNRRALVLTGSLR